MPLDPEKDGPFTRERCLRKADQHWDMAGLARADGDAVDAARHTALAKEWDEKAREAAV